MPDEIRISHFPGNVQMCFIINDQLVFNNHYEKRFVIYNTDGIINRGINLSGQPDYISVINDNDVAISYTGLYFEVININTGRVVSHIKTRGVCYGISFQSGLMYVISHDSARNVDVMNMTGELIRSFPCPSSDVRQIGSYSGKLYIIESFRCVLYCCDLYGLALWKYSQNEDLMLTLTVDGRGFVYMTSHSNCNVKVVSPAGKLVETIYERNGTFSRIIYYDKLNDCLMGCYIQQDNSLCINFKKRYHKYFTK